MILNGNEVVVDMFAGIGYFTLPLAFKNKYIITDNKVTSKQSKKEKMEEPQLRYNFIINFCIYQYVVIAIIA